MHEDKKPAIRKREINLSKPPQHSYSQKPRPSLDRLNSQAAQLRKKQIISLSDEESKVAANTLKLVTPRPQGNWEQQMTNREKESFLVQAESREGGGQAKILQSDNDGGNTIDGNVSPWGTSDK